MIKRIANKIYYHVTYRKNLKTIPASLITFFYSFDSMVYFGKLVVKDYVFEVARVLSKGGTAFLLHSNMGSEQQDSDRAIKICTPSDMSADLMKQYAGESGLTVTFQRLSGTADGWGRENLDCFSVLAHAT